ncbi:NAD(P)/FAD-dependent oxidoreductase [soil metagenome]
MENVDVIVIGAGQAGLATSYHLTDSGVDHVVIERDRVAQSWRDRWDSFTLVLPNWTLRLPGHHYESDEPDGYMPRDAIVSYLEDYARKIPAPLREDVEVNSLQRESDDWVVDTSEGPMRSNSVIVATGAFQQAVTPPGWGDIPDPIHTTLVGAYRSPEDLPPGKVLVIGSGQSGCQIAEDLVIGGREVFLSCGRAPWLPRRAGSRDIYWWLDQSGFMEMVPEDLSDPRERLGANPQLTGRDGGHDLHFRTLHEMGVTLLGHYAGSDPRSARFAPDLAASIGFGDQAYRQLRELVGKVASEHGEAIDLPDPEPWKLGSPEALDWDGVGAVVSASGFRPAYRSWIDLPEAFDELGFPVQGSAGSGVFSGLHFVGVHFLRKRRSALFSGVGEDAEVVVEKVAARLSA